MLAWNMQDFDRSILNEVPNMMITYINMPSIPCDLFTPTDCYTAYIIDKQRESEFHWDDFQFGENPARRNDVFGYFQSCNIFRFGH